LNSVTGAHVKEQITIKVILIFFWNLCCAEFVK
jgi:hypothetical protein